MNFRTDLAIELKETLAEKAEGITSQTRKKGDAEITRIKVENERGARQLGKPIGNYLTVALPPFSKDANIEPEYAYAVSGELKSLLPARGDVLVCGIGNTDITPDALGPKTASLILATRHIGNEFAKSVGLPSLRPVSVIAPGVLGQTGIEVFEIIKSIVRQTRPSAVIAVDALASRQLSRLGCTVQLADTGITPGAGVGNSRGELNEKTVGVPVISVGVPTVVDAATLVRDLSGIEPPDSDMVVTPREIDLLISRAARLIAQSVNLALQPELSIEDITALML
jgi:spore protease